MSVSTLAHSVLRAYREAVLPDGRPVLFRVVRRHHELRKPLRGAAVDEDILRDAQRRGMAGVALLRETTGQALWAPLAQWLNGLPIDFGFGAQRFLPFSALRPIRGRQR